MGGQGSGRIQDPAKQFREPKTEPRVPISPNMFLPNLSGDHSRGRIRTTPTTDLEIANKKYVDDTAGGSVPASNITPGTFGGASNYAFPTTLTIAGSILNITPTSGVSTIRSNDSNTRMDYTTNRTTSTQTAHRFIVNGTDIAMDIVDNKKIEMFDDLTVSGNIIVTGTVDGIDVATDVAANTTHRSSDGSDHADVVTNTAKVSFSKTNVKATINHGGTSGTSRPTGFDSVEWIGTVEPTNAANDDTWIDTT